MPVSKLKARIIIIIRAFNLETGMQIKDKRLILSRVITFIPGQRVSFPNVSASLFPRLGPMNIDVCCYILAFHDLAD